MDVMGWLDAREHEEPWHNRRYALSIEWLQSIVTPGARILEVGGGTIFTELLKARFLDITVERTSFDVRYDFPLKPKSFDIALCMEVLEHLQDRDPTNEYERAAFTGSGITNVLSEVRRVLRPAGWLFVTTPNACGWHNLLRMCNQMHPFFYSLHHRELSPPCVRAFLEGAGFSLKRLEAPVVWNNHQTREEFIQKMVEFLASSGFSTDLRGDDIFAIAWVAPD